jgi:DNA-binding transcriptional regulator PaaX
MAKVTDALLAALKQSLGRGRFSAIPSDIVANQLGVDERTVRVLVGELRRRGELIGSTSKAGHHGYFLIETEEDAAVGLAHMYKRARSMFEAWRTVRKSLAEKLSEPVVQRLFDVDSEGEGATA